MITQYGPYFCIGLVLALLFVLWSFFGQEEYEFIGISPLAPDDLDPIHDPTLPICPVSSSRVTVTEEPEICVDQTPVIEEAFSLSPKSYQKQKVSDKKFVSKGERICRETLERIYGVPFVSVRPSWLINTETGKALELDCYNEELRIALEYNGEQHYRWPNFTKQSYEEFINQARRDIYKAQVCRQRGIYLITVPYLVKHSKIPEYILSQLPETLQERLRENSFLQSEQVTDSPTQNR